MLQYPSIEGYSSAKAHLGKDCIAFYKYDGSNLRWEWSPKQSWHKFGTRKQMFDASTRPWNQAIPLFMDTIASDLEYRVKQLVGKKVERITAFTEYFGPSSFAGQHDWDEPKQLILFDVSTYKKGFIRPQQFVELFGKTGYGAQPIYKGRFTEELKQDVLLGRLAVNEGVIVKGTTDEFTVKLKTASWYARLKERFAEDWEQYA